MFINATSIKQKANIAINYVALFYIFCLPLSRAGIVFSSALLVVLWLIGGNYKEKLIILKESAFVVAALSLTAYILLTLLWSESISDGLYYFKRLWYYLVLFVLMTTLKREYIAKMIATFLSAMFISELLSYGIFFKFWTLHHGSPLDPTPFMNHLEYSLFLCAASALLLVKFLLEKEFNWKKVIYGAFFLSATTNLFITGGRTGQVAFILVVLMLFIFNYKNKIKGLVIASAVLASILFTASSLSPTFQTRMTVGVSQLQTFVETGKYQGSWGARLEFWDVGLSAIKETPLLGTGIGDITATLKEAKVNSQAIKHVSSGGYHSDLLEVTVAGGMTGAILFILIFVFLWRAKVKDPLVNNMRIIISVIFVFGWISDNFLRGQFTIVLFIFFLSIIFTQQRYEKTNAIQS